MEINSVASIAEDFLNIRKIARREGGIFTFRVNLTDALTGETSPASANSPQERSISMNRKQEILFKESTVWKAIFAMAIPAMINILVMILYNMADMFFIGQLGSSAQVAAVSISSPVFTMMMAFGSMIGGGGCALIARTLGAKDTQHVSLYSSLCCWGSILIGAVFALVVLLFQNPILGLLGANEDFREYARVYLCILALGAPVMIFTTSMGNVVRAEGAVKEGMTGNLISTVTNVVLDPLFILVFKWGVAGAAVATVIGNAAGAGYLIHYIRFKGSNLSLSPRLAAAAPGDFRKVIAIGLPNGTSNILSSVSTALANGLLVSYGTVAVAAMAASGKSTTIISMIQMGICMGVQPLMAYNYGAKDLPRIRETVTKLGILTFSFGLITTLLCFFQSESIIHLFLKDPNALELGKEMIRLRVLTGPFLGFYYISSNFLQASGNAKMSMLVSLLRQGIFFIPLIYVMNALFGVTGNICAHIAADTLAALVGVILAVRQYKILRKTLIA